MTDDNLFPLSWTNSGGSVWENLSGVCKQWSNSNLPASGIIDGCRHHSECIEISRTLKWGIKLAQLECSIVCFTFAHHHMRTLKSDQSPNVSIWTPADQKSNYGLSRQTFFFQGLCLDKTETFLFGRLSYFEDIVRTRWKLSCLDFFLWLRIL